MEEKAPDTRWDGDDDCFAPGMPVEGIEQGYEAGVRDGWGATAPGAKG